MAYVRDEDFVSKEEFERMEKRLDFLDCLEACGVDNWGGYSDACNMMNGDDE